MQPQNLLKAHYLFVLLTGFYLVMIFPGLKLPYFWDASWVYAPAIQAMVEHGPSLMPDAIPPDLSRGHPLLFHFLTALWIKIWGNGLVSVHLFMALISFGVLILTYLLARDWAGPEAGTLAATVLVVQELFLAQAPQCLPEAMLTFFILLSLWFYRRRQWTGYLFSATAMLYTKESGLVFIGVLAIHFLLKNWFEENTTSKRTLTTSLVWILLPVVLASLHYLWLKHRFGWYFYPLHINYFKGSWQDFYNDLRNIWRVQWGRDGRWAISLVAGVGLFMRLASKNWKLATGLLILSYLGTITFYRRWPEPDYWLKIVSLLAVIALLVYSIQRLLPGSRGKALFFLSLGYISLFSLFSAYNVFTIRYLHNLFPFYAFATAWGINILLHKKWMLPVAVGILLTGYGLWVYPRHHDGISDVQLNYADGLAIQQRLIDTLYIRGYDQMKIHASLLEMVATGHNYLGFLQGRDPVPSISFKLDSTTRVAVYTNIAQEPTYSQMDTLGFHREVRIEQGDAWGEIWIR
ncbi:MAG TPA: glycosyltransferase family 39 protein [Saprospiraceae bacterium]|nr:glycosyltransferase family 39 protein [Saprospiraceae bacterium]HPG07656.1 glycosyltransferase family 39 protein [Saprospiraceae bacterium]HQU52707.1 glycosyltransferase family 39 protein [Saprospiraceae bacterium]HRV84924.1 glycosyltransferase family 39 protein [Saprospiraceae bacterium]